MSVLLNLLIHVVHARSGLLWTDVIAAVSRQQFGVMRLFCYRHAPQPSCCGNPSLSEFAGWRCGFIWFDVSVRSVDVLDRRIAMSLAILLHRPLVPPTSALHSLHQHLQDVPLGVWADRFCCACADRLHVVQHLLVL